MSRRQHQIADPVARYGYGLTETKLLRVHRFFEDHGPKTVFIGRFIAPLRSSAAALAGVAEMPYGTFSLDNALGGIAWASAFGASGHVFGHDIPVTGGYSVKSLAKSSSPEPSMRWIRYFAPATSGIGESTSVAFSGTMP